MENENTYTQSSQYESLIRLAFNCNRGMRNGADLCFMQNAMTMEEGKTFAKHLGTFEKQFEKVKGYTSKALIKLAKTKPFSTERDLFLRLENDIKYLATTSELMDVVNLAVKKILEIKN